MYVTLEPCNMCASAIKQARISKLIIGSHSNDKEQSGITKQILKDIITEYNIQTQCKINRWFLC